MGIIKRIIAKRASNKAAKKTTTGLGAVYKTPSEAAAISGGYVSTSDPGTVSTYSPSASSGSGGSTSSGGLSSGGSSSSGSRSSSSGQSTIQGAIKEQGITPETSTVGRRRLEPQKQSVVSAAEDSDFKRTQWQEELREKESVTPKFGTQTGEGSFETFGEQQTAFEIKREGFRGEYGDIVQTQFESSGLTPEEYIATPEYEKLTTDYATKIASVPSVPGYYADPDLRTPTAKAVDIGKGIGEFGLSLTPPGAAIELAKSSQKDPLVYQDGSITSPLTGRTALAGAGVALVGGGTALGSYRAIEKGLVADELFSLSKAPSQFISTVDQTTGKVSTKAFQEFGALTRETTFTGKLSKTESGKLFIPEGTGTSRISGDLPWNIRGGVKPSKYIGIQEFSFGSTGTGIKAGTRGEVDIYSTIGKSSITPIAETSAIYKIPSTSKGATREGKLIGGQLSKVSFGGDTIKSFETGALFRTKGFDFGATERSKGIIFKVDSAPKNTFGFKTGTGKKTPFMIEAPSQPTKSIVDIKPTGKTSTGFSTPTASIKPSTTYSPISKVETLTQFKAPKIKLGGKSLRGFKAGLGVQSITGIDTGIKQFQPTRSTITPRLKPFEVPGLKEGFSAELKTDQLTSPSFNIPSTGTSSFGGFTGVGLPTVPIIPPIKPNLFLKKEKGSRSFSAERLYKYTPSFGVAVGLSEGTTTKGISFGGRKDVFTGFEQRKYKKKSKKKK